eukprot:TRINITY_DN40180_c0_g1_i1.p1 TRINITY_DN40180_c0_g1~~TRINITY_DN40180_c0_g1_i1.p1  ORF type:complete len:626 (+),score=58.99 TRINITY_DN40180_c0_g1_i1:139-1878(+)
MSAYKGCGEARVKKRDARRLSGSVGTHRTSPAGSCRDGPSGRVGRVTPKARQAPDMDPNMGLPRGPAPTADSILDSHPSPDIRQTAPTHWPATTTPDMYPTRHSSPSPTGQAATPDIRASQQSQHSSSQLSIEIQRGGQCSSRDAENVSPQQESPNVQYTQQRSSSIIQGDRYSSIGKTSHSASRAISGPGSLGRRSHSVDQSTWMQRSATNNSSEDRKSERQGSGALGIEPEDASSDLKCHSARGQSSEAQGGSPEIQYFNRASSSLGHSASKMQCSEASGGSASRRHSGSSGTQREGSLGMQSGRGLAHCENVSSGHQRVSSQQRTESSTDSGHQRQRSVRDSACSPHVPYQQEIHLGIQVLGNVRRGSGSSYRDVHVVADAYDTGSAEGHGERRVCSGVSMARPCTPDVRRMQQYRVASDSSPRGISMAGDEYCPEGSDNGSGEPPRVQNHGMQTEVQGGCMCGVKEGRIVELEAALAQRDAVIRELKDKIHHKEKRTARPQLVPLHHKQLPTKPKPPTPPHPRIPYPDPPCFISSAFSNTVTNAVIGSPSPRRVVDKQVEERHSTPVHKRVFRCI